MTIHRAPSRRLAGVAVAIVLVAGASIIALVNRGAVDDERSTGTTVGGTPRWTEAPTLPVFTPAEAPSLAASAPVDSTYDQCAPTSVLSSEKPAFSLESPQEVFAGLAGDSLPTGEAPIVGARPTFISSAGLSRPRRRQPGYVSKGVPYPTPVGVEVGTTHQVDLIGPRHLFGGVEFHTLNLVDVGSHAVGNDILEIVKPPLLAASLAGIWSRVGVPKVAQFDNHSNFRGGIPPQFQHFGPIVATCLDLGVTPRLIPLREPWRNGVVEHFNDVWDKAFFRTEVFNCLDHLRRENAAFVEFHNEHHRYSAHGGATPNAMWDGRLCNPLSASYRPPPRLPAQGRIEVVRYIRSNRRIDLFGNRIHVNEDQTHQYVTAIIKVRSKKVIVVTLDGEIIHDGDYPISRILR